MHTGLRLLARAASMLAGTRGWISRMTAATTKSRFVSSFGAYSHRQLLFCSPTAGGPACFQHSSGGSSFPCFHFVFERTPSQPTLRFSCVSTFGN